MAVEPAPEGVGFRAEPSGSCRIQNPDSVSRTANRVWAKEIRTLYKDKIEDVDLMVGLYAETPPPGFGFSDTAFRIFILMASRRLKSDRFFTVDYTPEIYTQTGLNWINENNMASVFLRHMPDVGPALTGVKNTFAPWNPVTVAQPLKRT